MELRQLTLDDTAAVFRLMSEAFGQGNRNDPPVLTEAPGYSCGIFDGARLVACATTYHLHVSWDDRIAPMGGVAGVACTADQRGRGHVGRLLLDTLRDMRERGEYLSALNPFSYAFYRKYGWDWVGERRMFTLPTRIVPTYPEGQCIRAYDGPDALAVVQPVYDAWARQYRTMTTRKDPYPKFWESALAHHGNRTTYVQVYHDPATGQAEGYLTFRYSDAPQQQPCTVGEMFALNPAAYRGLLSMIHYYGTQVSQVKVDGPADCPLPHFLMDHDLETKTKPLFMGRVVDVAAAFSAITGFHERGGEIVIQVADPHCEWNHRAFLLSVDPGTVTAEPTDRPAGISLDIQALSQAYWGWPTLDDLRLAGRIEVADETQFALLARLLPRRVSYIQDFF